MRFQNTALLNLQMKSRSKQKQQHLRYSNSPLSRLRTSIFKFDERSSDLYLLRNSYSSVALRNYSQLEPTDFRYSTVHQVKKNQMKSLKLTLDKLEDKVNAVKQQLQLPSTMKKNQRIFIEYQDVLEEKQTEKEEPTITATDSSVTLKNSDKKLAELITNIPKPKNFKPIYTNPYSPRRHATYYISEARRAVNQKNSLVVDHINGSIKIIKQCEAYEIPPLTEMTDKKLYLKKNERYKKKKTLAFDLDETLIHCVDNYEAQADLRLSIKLDGEQKVHHFGINIRPYALTFLKKMAQKFEIIIFTASQQQYADAILDQLDPDKQIFQHRLYRQHCWVLQNEMHVKDIRIINRNLSQMVLIDNAAYSYCFQLENGIPILPYYQGSDYELAALQSYLDEIDLSPDVRELNKQTFKLHHYTKFTNGQDLIEQLYIANTL